jgi:hypothetical protein
MATVKVGCPGCNKLVPRTALARHQYATGCRRLIDIDDEFINEPLSSEPPTDDFNALEDGDFTHEDSSWDLTSDPMPMSDAESHEDASPTQLPVESLLQPDPNMDPKIYRTHSVPYPGAGMFFDFLTCSLVKFRSFQLPC